MIFYSSSGALFYSCYLHILYLYNHTGWRVGGNESGGVKQVCSVNFEPLTESP